MRQKIMLFLFFILAYATLVVHAQDNRGYSDSGPNRDRSAKAQTNVSDDDNEFVDDDDSINSDELPADTSASTHHYVDSNGQYHPGSDSPTAMRKCGMTLEKVQARGFTIELTLPAPLSVPWMDYCKNGVVHRAHSIKQKRNGKTVGIPIVLAAGSKIEVNPFNDAVAYAAGCLNQFGGNIPRPPAASKRKENPPPAPAMCKNMDMTIKDWLNSGSDHYVGNDGRCIKPEAPAPPKRNCKPGLLWDEDAQKCVAPPECPTCPKIKTRANKEGLLNWKQAGLSAIVGAAISGAASNQDRWKNAAISGGISAGANVAARIPKGNRSDKSFDFEVSYPGQKAYTFTLKVGESYPKDRNGLKIDWSGDRWYVDSPDCNGEFSPRYANNFTPIPLIVRGGNTRNAIKNQVITPVRSRTDAGTGTITSRPTIGNTRQNNLSTQSTSAPKEKVSITRPFQ